jgi:F0F1-type ATP synthase assembly protein I
VAKDNKHPEKSSAGIGVTTLRGLVILAGIFLGLFTGLYADKVTGFDPGFTLLFIMMGIIAGSWGSIRLSKKKGV